MSEWVEVTSGVPQGTILGPLIFLLYINDIADDLNATCHLFADDCLLYKCYSEFQETNSLQKDLKGSGEDPGYPHQHDFEILQCKVNLRS